MASCQLCDSFVGPKKIEYSYIKAKLHAETHWSQLKKIDGQITMRKVIEKSFPDYAAAYQGRVTSSSQRHQSVIDLCHSIFAWTRKNPASHVLCQKCDVDICITDGQKYLKTPKIIEHAYGHLRLKLYECRKCGRGYNTKSAARGHLAKDHRIKSLFVAHIKDNSDEFTKEICAMVKSCFDGSKPRANVKEQGGAAIKSAGTSIVRARMQMQGSELAVERQLFCYRLIQKVMKQDGRVQCRLCSNRVNARDRRKTYQCRNVMHHALLHLQKPVFRCKHCPEASSSVHILDDHLKKEHTLRFASNYDFLGDQYHHEILDMLRKCFDEDGPAVSNAELVSIKGEAALRSSTKGSKLAVERNLFCYRLIQKLSPAQNGKVQCQYCTQSIVAKGTNALLHTIVHIGKPVYRCKICAHACCTKPDIYRHLKAEHALRGAKNYDFLADQYHRDIMDMLRKCYGGEEDEEDMDMDEVASEGVLKRRKPKIEPIAFAKERAMGSTLAKKRRLLCDGLVRKFADQDGKVQCRLCNCGISACYVGSKKFTSFKFAMHHALLHLDKPRIRCNECNKSFITREGVAQHLRNIHKLPYAGNFEDLTDQFHEEIMTMLRKCYDEEGNEAGLDGSQASLDGHAGESSTTRPRPLNPDLQRRQLCSKLVEKFTDQDGKIQCRSCKERLQTKDRRGCNNYKYAMEHAYVHFGKPLTRCNICSKGFGTRAKVAQHLKQVHRLPFAKNFECLIEQHHDEILMTLRECYGDASESESFLDT